MLNFRGPVYVVFFGFRFWLAYILEDLVQLNGSISPRNDSAFLKKMILSINLSRWFCALESRNPKNVACLVHEESLLGLVTCEFLIVPVCFQPFGLSCCFFRTSLYIHACCSISQKLPQVSKTMGLVATTFNLLNFHCLPTISGKKNIHFPWDNSHVEQPTMSLSRTTLRLHVPWCPCDFSIASVCSWRRRRILMSLGQHRLLPRKRTNVPQ